MLGLILIYFLGKWFFELARDFGKNKWLYAVLGVAVYYAGTILVGFIIGFMSVVFEFDSILNMPDIALSLIILPFGLLAAWGFRKILEQNWKRKVVVNDQLLDDSTSLDF